jgi:hypothetical protein
VRHINNNKITVSELSRLYYLNVYTGEVISRTLHRPVGSKNHDGYVRIRLPGNKGEFAHRIVWALTTGKFPDEVIDHKNGIRDDNVLSNLRACSQSINNQNVLKLRKDSKYSYPGIRSTGRRFEARIRVRGILVVLGTFDTELEAYQCYLRGKAQLHVHFR